VDIREEKKEEKVDIIETKKEETDEVEE